MAPHGNALCKVTSREHRGGANNAVAEWRALLDIC